MHESTHTEKTIHGIEINRVSPEWAVITTSRRRLAFSCPAHVASGPTPDDAITITDAEGHTFLVFAADCMAWCHAMDAIDDAASRAESSGEWGEHDAAVDAAMDLVRDIADAIGTVVE